MIVGVTIWFRKLQCYYSTLAFKLRKGDELQGLADAINEVIKGSKTISRQNLAYIVSLDDTLQNLKTELDREPIDLMKSKLLLSKLQEISADLKNITADNKGKEKS